MLDFKGKNIVITGINGFIGSNAAKYFLNEGAHVIGLVRDINRKTRHNVLSRCSVVRGDIRDYDVVRYMISHYEADYILHLAASPIVRICNSDPVTAYETNILGTLNVLEACRNINKRPAKILIKTSDKAYGSHEKLPYTEESPLLPFDTYCTSKACQDFIAQSFGRSYDLPVVVVRAGNIFGGGDLNISRLIPRTILRMLDGKAPVLYGGVDNYVREFIYVKDAINAYAVLLIYGNNSEAYNIGGTGPKKVIDIITKIKDKIDPNIGIKVSDKDFEEINAQYLCGAKLQALGWNPKYTLDRALDETIGWYRRYHENGGTVCL